MVISCLKIKALDIKLFQFLYIKVKFINKNNGLINFRKGIKKIKFSYICTSELP